jgi:methylphosphotriester-DNA--protein-cysteine methyltransferase
MSHNGPPRPATWCHTDPFGPRQPHRNLVTAADQPTARLLHQTQTALIDTKQSAKDLATHLNFGSATNFTRFVQQHTGLTPTLMCQNG